MTNQLTNLANEMLQQNFWWSFSKEGSKEELTLSSALQDCLNRPINSIEDLMGEYKTEQIRLKIEEALSLGVEQIENLDMRFVAAYETQTGKRSFQHKLKVFYDSGKKTVWGNCIDVTEMVKLERDMVDAQGRMSIAQMYEHQELLEEQNKFIRDSYDKQSRFLALLSHELRSPLLGISGLVKRLKNELDATPAVLNMLKTIGMTAEQSTYLVNDILTYSQTEYDGIKLHPSKVSLSEILENLKQLTKSIATDKNLNISLVNFCEHDEIYADSVRLTQILINLMVNSIKFTQYGGVNLEVKELEKGRYHFKVSDSGEGIPAEKLHSIFEPFAQLDSNVGGLSKTPRYLGAGLGLFVVQQLITLMDGEIDVHSTEGVGTTFEFLLPLSLEFSSKQKSLKSMRGEQPKLDTNQAALSPGVELEKGINKEDNQFVENAHFKVLVADDSKINCMVLAGYLADLNCDVIEAKDGRQAWQLFQKNQFDYVMLDIQMPFMDGIQVSQKIDRCFQAGQVPWLKGVFAITAGGDSIGFIDSEEKHESVGFDEWLVKPVTKEQVVQLLYKNYRQTKQTSEMLNPIVNDSISVEERETESVSSTTVNQNELSVVDDIPQQFQHLVSPFIDEMKTGMDDVLEFNGSNDVEAIKKMAHYLKGNCMLFQLTKLVELCKLLEITQGSKQIDEGEMPSREQKTLDIVRIINLHVKSLEKSLMISHNSNI